MVPFLEDRLSTRRVSVVAWMVLTIVVALHVFALLAVENHHTPFGPALGGDFAGFYNAGRIVVDHGAHRLYDLPLQSALYHDLLPTAPANESLPFAHAPFLALLMAPLALLPYSVAYAIFLILAPATYFAGSRVLRPALQCVGEHSLTMLLAMSYLPFLIENWIGGQFAWFGFVWTAIALRCMLSGHNFVAGLALSICLYKPTLLVLIVPMLLMGRQFRVLLGIGAGAVALASISVITIGLDGCAGYVDLLLNYSGGADASAGFRTFKYVDVVSFANLLGGGTTLVVLIAAGAGALLARTWWSYPTLADDERRLAWAALLCLTPVLNVYAPIYDTLLPVIGLLLVADVALRRGGKLPNALRLVLVLVYIVPWFSQALAKHVGFQPFTLVLLAGGIWCLQTLRCSALQIRPHPLPRAREQHPSPLL